MHLYHFGEFHPYGFPAVVRSNSPLVLSAARESWGHLTKRFDEPPVEVRCMVAESAATARPPEPVYRAQGNLLTATADRENYFCCDLQNGFGFGWVTPATAADTAYLRYFFVEAMVGCLVDLRHLVSVHAACVALDGHGVLLAGESGAGKSSLAYACARRGWAYCSDDASVLLRRGTGRTVIAKPDVFRFRSAAGELFPEFQQLSDHRRGNGKPTIEVATASLPGIRTAREAHIDHIVFLNRPAADAGKARLLRISESEALGRIDFSPWPQELPACGEMRATLKRLVGAPAYELRYRDLDDAADRLEQLVRGGPQ
jgi:hypothetical protein